jgi:hypothetical protein
VRGASRRRIHDRHAVGAYLNFETQLDARRLRLTFPPATLERLLAVKRRVDPDNVCATTSISTGSTDRDPITSRGHEPWR